MIASQLVIKACIALGAGFKPVEEIVNDFIQRQHVFQLNAPIIDVGHILEHAALVLAKVHHRAHIIGRRVNFRFYDRLFHILDIGNVGQVGRVVHKQLFPVRFVHLITNGRSRRNDIQIKLSFNAFLDNFHMQKA